MVVRIGDLNSALLCRRIDDRQTRIIRSGRQLAERNSKGYCVIIEVLCAVLFGQIGSALDNPGRQVDTLLTASDAGNASSFVSHFKIFKSRTNIAYMTGTCSFVTTVAINSPPICA